MNRYKLLKQIILTLIVVCMLVGSAVLPAMAATEQEIEPTSIMPLFSTDPLDYSVTSERVGIEPVKEPLSTVNYAIKYDANGGNGDGLVVPLTTSNLIYGDQHVVLNAEEANVGLRAGYVFAGWNAEKDGSGLIGNVSRNFIPAIHTFTATNITLYAQWTKVLSATPYAHITHLHGSQDGLTIVVFQYLSDGTTNLLEQSFEINNATGIYQIGSYNVSVSISADNQIRNYSIV
ncbi:MAG: InlB B-repeat-containing protein [Nitrososphaerota archaeon]|jgi:uncharacterized repeat protein (TIGR02543 family)|nr:InlB B-repeat-containing protein [Nitrososphaerota archaeon]